MTKVLLLLCTSVVAFGAFVLAGPGGGGSTEPLTANAPAVRIPVSAAERLAGSLRIPTVSSEDRAAFDAAAFQAFHVYLQSSFPRVHEELRREKVAQHSVLYTWGGSDSSLDPILLMGHLDVVPVEAASGAQWQHDPFGGGMVDGYIWGRGAIDNKSTVMGTLEAVEMLLQEGFRPSRTVYLAYGHDEEVGGTHGAREIAALLKARGVELEMVLDEGGVVGDGLLPGITRPVAMVGIAEKGFLSVELSTRVPAGHSSLPPKETAIGILSAAVTRLEQTPMEARLDGPTRELFERVGPRFPPVRRAVFANLWLTRRLVLRQLQENRSTNAMVRTTSAPTLFAAGTKDNVLPSEARAVINFRILPGDSIADVLEHVERVVADNRVRVQRTGHFSAEPSAAWSTDSASFRTLERAIRHVLPEAVVAPYLVVVATDARHYSSLTRSVFRFQPLRLDTRDLQRIHGVDERIRISDYATMIRIYRQLLREAA